MSPRIFHSVVPVLKFCTFVCALVFTQISSVRAQQNVFQLFQDDEKKGDEYFREGSFRHALEVYLSQQHKGSTELELKIARSYYHLHDYARSMEQFEKVAAATKFFSAADNLLFAEVLAANGKYSRAIDKYQEYLRSTQDDELIQNKIWRLKNIQFLFEDSLHFSVRMLPINSTFSDFAPVPYQDGLVFLSNRKNSNTFESADALTGENDFRLYYAPAVHDPGSGAVVYLRTSAFKGLEARSHSGPVMFYSEGTKAVFTKVSGGTSRNSKKTLQLFFAERQEKSWVETGAFQFNSTEYNLSEPFITSDGSTLYFSSEMKGGYGGKDIYKSEWKSNGWTTPRNLGSVINTRLDESFPHIYKNHLYFSSNGHPGMGGLDVFKVPMLGNDYGDITNPGFPLNSCADDFAFSFRPDGNGAFLTSNRGNSSDDIYEVEIDLQSYPVRISGTLKTKDFSLSDSTRIHLLPSARMYLIDHTREIIIDEVSSDADGHFELSIPYFSQYKIRVVETSGAESIVSLQIPRQKKSDYNHEIVVVKDAFHTPEE
jgi:tetratricopeptide (TPR) repeat protein